MQKTITNSVNISVLDSQVIADLCAGNFLVDLSPTTWIGTGAANVLGAKVKIINPYDVTIKDYGAGYDIVPPMTGVFSFPVPKQLNNYQYGLYKVSVQITDAGGKTYEITDNLTICEPNPKDKTKKYGIINAKIVANCKQSMVTIMIDEPPVYKGKLFESKTQSYTLTYPTDSGVVPFVSIANAFSTNIFPGVYSVKGDVCVTYNFGDNNYIRVPYKVNCKKNVQCTLDLCCVYDRVHQLNQELGTCHGDKSEEITNVILDAMRLITTVQIGSDCGEDVSDYISELEVLLGCKCTCSASDSTPLSNGIPAENVVVQGCNIDVRVDGLTTTYTIDNYEYVVSVNPASNSIIAFSPSTVNGCVKEQQLTFNVAGAYAAIKTQIINLTEYTYWANIVKGGFIPTPANLLCLGITQIQYAAMDYSAFMNAVIAKMCGCCAGSTCDAVIANEILTQQGGNELFTWTNIQNVFAVDIYIDGSLAETVLAPINSYSATLIPAASHTYQLIAKCSNGAQGNVLSGTFMNAGCPTIPAASLSSSSVADAACPYDLTTLTPAAAAGFTLEWHNQNNRNVGSLVGNPAAVTSGTYYVFVVQNSSNCSSPSASVNIACAVAGNCTEPIAINAVITTGTNILVSFNSASTPPPSYLVKRRLASDPDTGGSYTTIGAPSFNIGSNKWEITDATAAANTLYVYKAESQCADATRPSTQYTYANLTCPVMAYNPTDTVIGYSFTNVGGGVDKYEIKIYDQTASVLIATQTKTPAFATPITGSFTGLDPATQYRVGVRVYIGTTYKDCPLSRITTGSGSAGAPLAVNLIRTGAPSGTLTAYITGGTAPYDYSFSIVGIGDCEAHTIDTPTGTVPDTDTPVTTAFTTIAYQGTVYTCSCSVVDANSTVATSNNVVLPGCLVPETLITMKDGTQKALGTLQENDELFGEENKILSFKRTMTDVLYVINGGLLKSSPGHIHIVNGGMKPAIDLIVGEKYATIGGGVLEIYTIEKILGEFEVIDIATTNGTYYANSVLTHNKTTCP